MKLVFETSEAKMWFDAEHKIFKVQWFGVVNYDSFRGLILCGRDILEKLEYAHFLFDRRQLDSFSADARVWLKYDFMKKGGDGRRLIKRIRRIAAVKSSSVIAQIAAQVFSKIFMFFNPSLRYRTFSDELSAECWVKGIPLLQDMAAQTTKVERKGNFLTRLFKV